MLKLTVAVQGNMTLKSAQPYILFIILITLFIFTFNLQLHFLLYTDNEWFLYAAARLLAHGSYSQDFFEVNPPFIMLLLTPVVIAAKYMHIEIATLFNLYILSIACLSLSLTANLSRHLLSSQEQFIFIIILTLVAIVFPLNNIGQREHLLFLTTLPYLFSLAYQLHNLAISRIRRFFIGLFAFCGIALKPYFVLIFIVAEVYYLYQKKSLLAFFRIESIVILITLLCYSFCSYYFFPDYFAVIIPLALKTYFNYYAKSFIVLLQQPYAVLAYFSVLFALAYRRKQDYLRDILTLSTITYLLIYFLHRTIWYYHQLPFFCMSILLATLVLLSLLQDKKLTFNQISRLTGVALLMLFFAKPYFLSGLLITAPYFSSVLGLIPIFMIFYQRNRTVKSTLLLFFIIFLFLAFYYTALNTIYMGPFRIELCVIFGVFIIFASANHNKIYQNLLFFLFTVMFGALAYSYLINNYIGEQISDKKHLILLKKLAPYKHKKIYFITEQGWYNTLLRQGELIPAYRIHIFWWLPGEFNAKTAYEPQNKIFNEQFLLSDLKKYEPDIIFFELNSQYDFLSYFLQDPHIRLQLANYHTYTLSDQTSNGQILFSYQVYEKNS